MWTIFGRTRKNGATLALDAAEKRAARAEQENVELRRDYDTLVDVMKERERQRTIAESARVVATASTVTIEDSDLEANGSHADEDLKSRWQAHRKILADLQ